MFGHVKDSFTGANIDRIGGFEYADGGTVFLNEIGDVPMELQGKLLDVIETKRFKRVGENEETPSDFRLICATNKNLAELIQKGRFREDLYYRVNIIELTIPELKGYPEDIERLSDFFFDAASKEHNVLTIKNKRKVIREFKQCTWPGNVRELKNIIERATVLAENGIVDVDSLLEYTMGKTKGASMGKDETLYPLSGEAGKKRVLEVLGKNNWNKSGKKISSTGPATKKMLSFKPWFIKFGHLFRYFCYCIFIYIYI